MTDSEDFELVGKTAVVTGGSKGIGEAIVIELLRAGASVVSLQRGALSDRVGAVAMSLHRQVEARAVDILQADELDQVAKDIAKNHQIDVLVNNAGIQARHDAVDFPLSEFDRVYEVNLRAVFQLSQIFVKGMIERRDGAIVNLASMLTFQGGLRVPAYAAAKGGVGQLTKALCNEWAPYGVRVNAVAPGYLATEMNTALFEADAKQGHITQRIPTGRWGRPEEIAHAVRFLATPAARYINGIVLPVDGGWLAR